MTEDEAKQKMCPFRFSGITQRTSEDRNCCASHCMAWEWQYTKSTDRQGDCRLMTVNAELANVRDLMLK